MNLQPDTTPTPLTCVEAYLERKLASVRIVDLKCKECGAEDTLILHIGEIPEVKALVEDLRIAKTTCLVQRGLEQHFEHEHAAEEWQRLANRFSSHLTPFQEPTNE